MARQAAAPAGVRAAKRTLLSYRYVAQAGEKRNVKGTVRAISEIAAQGMLVERGYTPISVDPVASALSLEGALPSFFGLKQRQVISFCRQLATLLESGVSLLPAIQLLEMQQSSSTAIGRVLRSISQDLGTGKSFAQAISRHTTAFSDIFIRTIRVGERSGKLETVLKQMADFIEKQTAFGKKLKGALTYPTMVIVIGVVVSVVLLVVAMPPMARLYTSMKVDLPLPTRILMAASGFITSYMLYVGGGVGALVVSMMLLMRRPRGRRMADQLRLKVPILGEATRLAEMARISRTTTVLLAAGLPLQEIVDLLPQTTQNSIIREALQRVKGGLMLGQGLTHPMSTSPIFPPLMIQMVRVGEESNALEQNFTALANFYEEASEEKTAALIGMITPMSTIGVAAFAGFIALSVIMPMYQITGSVK